MLELQSKVDELHIHSEYQLRLKDMDANEKIKEVTEKFTQELEQGVFFFCSFGIYSQ